LEAPLGLTGLRGLGLALFLVPPSRLKPAFMTLLKPVLLQIKATMKGLDGCQNATRSK
jgi:hypothetical protein